MKGQASTFGSIFVKKCVLVGNSMLPHGYFKVFALLGEPLLWSKLLKLGVNKGLINGCI